MGQKSIPTPLAASLITLVVIVAGIFLYKGMTGGVVSNGEAGKVQAAPPMPDAAKQELMQGQLRRP